MSLVQAKEPLSEIDVKRIFDVLGLATQEERDRFSFKNLTTLQEQPAENLPPTKLSNNTTPETHEVNS